MNSYSGEGQDLRPCWVFEEVHTGVWVTRDGDGAVVAVFDAEGTPLYLREAELHPAMPGAYQLEPGETDAPGRVY